MTARKAAAGEDALTRKVLEITEAFGAFRERLDNFVSEFKEERTAAAQRNSDTRIVLSSMTTAVQALTAQVADLKPLVNDHQDTRDTVAALTRDVGDLRKDMTGLQTDVADYREKRAEARGAVKAADWIRRSLIGLASIALMALGYVIKQKTGADLPP